MNRLLIEVWSHTSNGLFNKILLSDWLLDSSMLPNLFKTEPRMFVGAGTLRITCIQVCICACLCVCSQGYTCVIIVFHHKTTWVSKYSGKGCLTRYFGFSQGGLASC